MEDSTDGTKQIPTGFDAHDFDAKLVCQLAPSRSLTLAYQLSRQNHVPRYDKYENDRVFRWLHQPQKRSLLYLVLEDNVRARLAKAWKASLSLHRQEEGREIQKTATSPRTKERDDVRTIGLTFQLEANYRHHLFTLGTELYLDEVASERFILLPESGEPQKDARGRFPDGATYSSFGLFLQDELFLRPEWTVIGGIRGSFFDTDFAISRARFGRERPGAEYHHKPTFEKRGIK